MAQKETAFKRRVLLDLRALPRCWFVKTQQRAQRGVPDLIICLGGRFIAIELKVDGEKPDPLQSNVLKRIQKSDGIAFHTTPSQWPMHLALLQGLG